MLLKAGGGDSDYKTLETGTYNGMCVEACYPIMKQYSPQDKPKSTTMALRFEYHINDIVEPEHSL